MCRVAASVRNAFTSENCAAISVRGSRELNVTYVEDTVIQRTGGRAARARFHSEAGNIFREK